MSISKVGKWSVGLNAFFLIVIVASLVFVLILKKLSFDDHWWDVTVPIAFLIEMVAFFIGIRAVRRYKERSVLVFFSIFMGIATILFALLHSLFIHD